MVEQEFSDQFDILYNNITSNQAVGLNEYEKSVFLTKAQAQLVNEYFNNRTDGFGGGFDGSQKRQYDFSELIRTESLVDINTFNDRINDTERLDKRSKVFLFPYNYYLAVNEIISDTRQQYSVLPLSYTEYQRLMLKPYSFPVKRGVWRIITDKKNCNYCHEDSKGNKISEPSTADYVILTSWADRKRSLNLTIKVIVDLIEDPSTDYIGRKEMIFQPTDNLVLKVEADCSWSKDNLSYNVELKVTSPTTIDDEETILYLREGFTKLNKAIAEDPSKTNLKDGDLYKAATHTDGMLRCSAPSKFTTFKADAATFTNGRTFNCEVVQIPMAEIIGKFTGDISYQIRYITELSPIILEDLTTYGDDLTINGEWRKTGCKLPKETHQEILERAVTLAKIAWAGGTSTTASAQSKE